MNDDNTIKNEANKSAESEDYQDLSYTDNYFMIFKGSHNAFEEQNIEDLSLKIEK